MDDLDYETKFLYRVPERRLSHSKYSRRIQHGIRNDADGERTTKRVATQYENEQRRSVKRLKLKNRLLREENFKTAQKLGAAKRRSNLAGLYRLVCLLYF